MATSASATSFHPPRLWRRARPLAAVLALVLAAACSPTVRLETPKEPIRIDLTVKVEQDVRVTLVDARGPAGESGVPQ